LDAAQPHHELIMVADNLGSIPPNASVMIITPAAGAMKFLFLPLSKRITSR
jgi:hypothetical protein